MLLTIICQEIEFCTMFIIKCIFAHYSKLNISQRKKCLLPGKSNQFMHDERDSFKGSLSILTVVTVHLINYAHGFVWLLFVALLLFWEEWYGLLTISLPLLHWHWGNHMIAILPSKQDFGPWKIWMKFTINKTQALCIVPLCFKTHFCALCSSIGWRGGGGGGGGGGGVVVVCVPVNLLTFASGGGR